MVIGLVDETQSLVRVVFSHICQCGGLLAVWPIHASPESQRRQPKQSLCRIGATDGSPNSIS